MNCGLAKSRLLVARLAWLLVASASITLCVAYLPTTYGSLANRSGPLSAFGQDAAVVRQGLAQLGVSPGGYARYVTALRLVYALAVVVLAAALYRRKSAEWVAWLYSLSILTYGTGFIVTPWDGVLALPGLPGLAIRFFSLFCGVALYLVFLYAFPDGRFAPAWTRWLAGATLGLGAAATVFGAELITNVIVLRGRLPPTWFVLLATLFLLPVAVQAYRFRFVANAVQRQQTKWAVYGFSTAIVINVLAGPFFLSGAGLSPTTVALFDLGGITTLFIANMLAPAGFAVALFRYRLWDIDLIIRRTLIYSALTAALALVYFSGVVLLQGLFRAVTGQESQLAVVASTLAIAALFSPLRRRVQGFIDRRFFRRKYDAARTLAEFAAAARDETDLDRLAARLVGVVEETMQPEVASLWLRELPAEQAPAIERLGDLPRVK